MSVRKISLVLAKWAPIVSQNGAAKNSSKGWGAGGIEHLPGVRCTHRRQSPELVKLLWFTSNSGAAVSRSWCCALPSQVECILNLQSRGKNSLLSVPRRTWERILMWQKDQVWWHMLIISVLRLDYKFKTSLSYIGRLPIYFYPFKATANLGSAAKEPPLWWLLCPLPSRGQWDTTCLSPRKKILCGENQWEVTYLPSPRKKELGKPG